MKQTNNAIKFLMAQYRAIFKNAYFKGLTSAVLLTAGLAAGAAQAADIDSADILAGLSGNVTVNGTGTGSTPNTTFFSNLQLDATSAAVTVTNPNAATITITSGAAGTDNYIKAASSNAATVTGSQTNIVIASSTDNTVGLTISGSASAVASLTVADMTINKGTLNLTGGAANTGAATLKADTIVLGGTAATDAKITFAAANTTADWAVLEGRLTNEGSGTGTLDFTGFGTLKTYTDDNGANVDITVSGSKGATLDLSANTDPTQRTLKLVDGNFDINADASTAGVFTIKNGTLEIANEVELTSSGSAGNSGGVIKLEAKDADDNAAAADQAVLKISSEKLLNFLGDKQSDGSTTDVAGVVNLAKGTIELTDEADISTLKFAANAGTNENGAITVSSSADSSFIKGTNLSITKTVTGAADKLTVQADKITLTELTDSGSTNSLGVGKTIAASYDFKLNEEPHQDNGKEVQADSAYTIGEDQDLVYATTTTVDNPYQVEGADPAAPDTITVAGTGTIGEDLIVSGDGAKLEIYAGHYSDANDITLSSGSLTIGGQSGDGNQYKGVDASLTLENGATLILDNTKANTITIAGNGKNADWGTSSLGYDAIRASTGVLDLTAGDVEFKYFTKAPTSPTQANQNTTFKVNGGGELVLRNDQVDYLLNNLRAQEQRADNVSGAKIELSGGYLTVQGDLDLSTDDLTSGSGTQDAIAFDSANGGLLQVDGNLTIEADDEATNHGLDIGSKGHISADVIALNNLNLNTAGDAFEDFRECKILCVLFGVTPFL